MGVLKLVEPVPGVIEVVGDGFMREGDMSYLKELEARVESKPAVCILYNTEKISGFEPKFTIAHAGPFRRWLKRVPKIAVSHATLPISLAVSTVRLASGANLKAFTSREEALAWLTS